MSHFTCLVVIRSAEDVKHAERALDDILEPFNECRDVPEYVVWVDQEKVDQAVKFYRDNPQFCNGEGEDSIAKPFDEFVTEGNLEAWREWTRQAVGAYHSTVAGGVYDSERDRYGYRTTYNPDSKWDWWSLGGRWQGFFRLKEGASAKVGDPSAFHPIGTFKGLDDAPENVADLARKGDIDFEGMRAEAETRARETYDKFEEATRGIEVPPTFAEMRKKAYFDAGIDPDGWADFMPDLGLEERREKFNAPLNEARQRWNDDPWVKALRGADLISFFGDTHDDYCVFDESPRETFVQRARDRATSTFAVLLDGTWYEKGDMGWWGMVGNEKDESMWLREHARLIDSLPDDAYLAVVDCHI